MDSVNRVSWQRMSRIAKRDRGGGGGGSSSSWVRGWWWWCRRWVFGVEFMGWSQFTSQKYWYWLGDRVCRWNTGWVSCPGGGRGLSSRVGVPGLEFQEVSRISTRWQIPKLELLIDAYLEEVYIDVGGRHVTRVSLHELPAGGFAHFIGGACFQR